MKRFLLVLAAIAPLGMGACNKPTQEDCRQAISNMEKLLGTEAASRLADNEGEVRRCRGGSTKEAVACAIKAQTPEDLKACSFMGTKGKPRAAPTPNAPTPSAPSAPSPTTPSPTTPAPSAPPTTPAPSAPAPSAPAPSAPGK